MTVMKGTDTREYRTHSSEETEALGEKPEGAEEGGAGEKDQNEGKEP